MKGDSISAMKVVSFTLFVLSSTDSSEMLNMYERIVPLVISGSSHVIVMDCGPLTVAVRFLGTPGTARKGIKNRTQNDGSLTVFISSCCLRTR